MLKGIVRGCFDEAFGLNESQTCLLVIVICIWLCLRVQRRFFASVILDLDTFSELLVFGYVM